MTSRYFEAVIADRIFLSPTWMRGLLGAGVSLAFLVAYVAFGFPTFVHRAGWMWVAIACVVVSLIETAALLWAGRPARGRLLSVLDGLTTRQRHEALAALRTGKAPADHAVLLAAIKVGDLRRAYRRGTPRSRRTLQWWVPLLLLIVAVLVYIERATRLAELFAVVAVLSMIRSALFERRAQRTATNLDLLRAAAASSGLASETADDGEVLVALPKRRALIFLAAAIIPFLLLVAVMQIVDKPRPDCHTVQDLATFIYDNRQLEVPQSPTLGSLDVAAYQAWSDRLQGFAHQVSNPAVAPRVRHIADLSLQAVAQVRAAHSTPDGNSGSARNDFQRAIGQLIDEDNALMAYCF